MGIIKIGNGWGIEGLRRDYAFGKVRKISVRGDKGIEEKEIIESPLFLSSIAACLRYYVQGRQVEAIREFEGEMTLKQAIEIFEGISREVREYLDKVISPKEEFDCGEAVERELGLRLAISREVDGGKGGEL